jgi:hypothetical protein
MQNIPTNNYQKNIRYPKNKKIGGGKKSSYKIYFLLQILNPKT